MGIGSPSRYAAFGPKEALYVEALRHCRTAHDAFALDRFEARAPIRDVVERYPVDTAEALAAQASIHPPGRRVTLASVCRDDHRALYDLLRSLRATTFERLVARLRRAVAEGDPPASNDVASLARFLVTVLFGMSIQARDGASAEALAEVARIAMLGWDARTGAVRRRAAPQSADRAAMASLMTAPISATAALRVAKSASPPVR